jgi:TPR repeat protein
MIDLKSLSEELQDPVYLEPMKDAVTLFPCGHVVDEKTAKHVTTCPLDREPIQSYVSNTTVRNVVAKVQNLPLVQPAEPAVAHFERGRELFQQCRYQEATAAFMCALSIFPKYDSAKAYFDCSVRLQNEQLNHCQAYYARGKGFEEGSGVTRDYKRAFKCFRMAARKGYAPAARSVGCFYFHGKGVEQDYKRAYKWLSRAAAQGDTASTFDLGVHYYHGYGVPRDLHEAFRLWKAAATKGDAHAAYNVGYCYEKGEGVAENLVEAVRWFKLAAEANNKDACYALAKCFENGLGVAKDKKEALNCYQKAAKLGHLKARARLESTILDP